ncbi:DNA polymerase III subunit epsilon [Acidihalobacter ferrooxydans]|uniref:DNA polymerase III subunit epsilon n=1 Tax=Acidihalobacter ferrooxydans TaxID=1765967 RepID=A0A1P8UEE5_9GAMM|nr:DNA polymerase III subunit epsilon [Acidihalobacter ferrooxydans]APZ42225.1 DNA polymerase III subunit epsilon [Acidihalobacter ferrooxydans]
MRQIVLDTETTGLEHQQGHRIIEIGCVELERRRATGRYFHHYIQPDREVDEGALAVHGISNEFLADKPRFDQVVDEFLEFVCGAELIIHNAPFDMGFLNAELKRLGERYPAMETQCSVIDSLALARQMHPGQRNSLDALCKRYGVNNEHRELHGALLDARILADVYLVMTGGQTSLSLGAHESSGDQAQDGAGEVVRRLADDRPRLRVISATKEELDHHAVFLDALSESAGGACIWSRD